MTPLKNAVTHSTGTIVRGRELIARMAPEGVYLKGSGQRWSSAYLVPWGALYDLGGRLKARMLHEERIQKRKARGQR